VAGIQRFASSALWWRRGPPTRCPDWVRAVALRLACKRWSTLFTSFHPRILCRRRASPIAAFCAARRPVLSLRTAHAPIELWKLSCGPPPFAAITFFPVRPAELEPPVAAHLVPALPCRLRRCGVCAPLSPGPSPFPSPVGRTRWLSPGGPNPGFFFWGSLAIPNAAPRRLVCLLPLFFAIAPDLTLSYLPPVLRAPPSFATRSSLTCSSTLLHLLPSDFCGCRVFLLQFLTSPGVASGPPAVVWLASPPLTRFAPLSLSVSFTAFLPSFCDFSPVLSVRHLWFHVWLSSAL